MCRCGECGRKIAEIQCKRCPKLATSPGIFIVCKDCDASIHSLPTRQGHEREEIAAITAMKKLKKERKKKEKEDHKKKMRRVNEIDSYH